MIIWNTATNTLDNEKISLKPSKIIVFEGLDGTGKSIAIENIVSHLRKFYNATCKIIKFPSENMLTNPNTSRLRTHIFNFMINNLRQSSLSSRENIRTINKYCIYLADIYNTMHTYLMEGHNRGIDYIFMDRYIYSNLYCNTYIERDTDNYKSFIKDSFYTINELSIPEPDLIVFFDVYSLDSLIDRIIKRFRMDGTMGDVELEIMSRSTDTKLRVDVFREIIFNSTLKDKVLYYVTDEAESSNPRKNPYDHFNKIYENIIEHILNLNTNL